MGELTQIVGRDSSFTGRTEFWQMLLGIGARHPFLGTGFGGYFGTPGNEFEKLYHANEGHNGLVDIFVELGMLGVILIIAFHLRFYKKFRGELINVLDWGVLGICLLVISWLTNFSESLFLNLNLPETKSFSVYSSP